MRPCPRCSIPMRSEARQFAKIDVCGQCGGAFFDPGEGVAVHSADAEPSFLMSDGKAVKVRASALRCPAHAGVDGGSYREGPSAAPSADAPVMDVYAIGGDDPIEIDYCPACGGFFLDAGEDVALLELASEAEAPLLTTATGATFAAPPGEAQNDVVREHRDKKGKSAFTEMMRGIFDGLVEHQRRKRIIRRTGGATGPFSPYED